MKKYIYIASICILQYFHGVIIIGAQMDLIYGLLFVSAPVGFLTGILFGLLGREYKNE